MAEFLDQKADVQHINGTAENDVFVIDGASSDYNWGPTEDGNGFVIWRGDDFDILHGVERVRFNDLELSDNGNGALEVVAAEASLKETSASPQNENTILDAEDSTQFVFGTDDHDVFVIDGNSSEYGWGPTEDGKGLVVWRGDAFDIFYDVDEIRFSDVSLMKSEDGSYQSLETADDTSEDTADNFLVSGTVNGSLEEEVSQEETRQEDSSEDDASAEDNSEVVVAENTDDSDRSSEQVSDDAADETEASEEPETVETVEAVETVETLETVEAEEAEETVETVETVEETEEATEEVEETETVEAKKSNSVVAINGDDTLKEGFGGGFYTVELAEAVEEDTWVTVRINSETARQEFGDDHKNKHYWYINDRQSLENKLSGSSNKDELMDHYFNYLDIEVGPDNLNRDFKAIHKGVTLETNEVQLLVKAGEKTSEHVQIYTNQEYNIVQRTESINNPEADETLSLQVTQIGDQQLSSGQTSTGQTFQETPDDQPTFEPFEKKITIIDRPAGTPIALDLNGDGKIGVTGETSSFDKVGITEVGHTVNFDLDGDGDLDTVEWFDGSGDGILIDNRDGNAATDMNGSRLFGDQGGQFANGYEKLALFDTNEDGVVSGEELTGIELWLDDGDAVVEEGEIQTLSDHGIVELSTTIQQAQDEDGRTLIQSSAKNEAGEEILTEDVWFYAHDYVPEAEEAEEPANSYNMELRFLETDMGIV